MVRVYANAPSVVQTSRSVTRYAHFDVEWPALKRACIWLGVYVSFLRTQVCDEYKTLVIVCSSQELGKPSCYANYSGLQSGTEHWKTPVLLMHSYQHNSLFVDRGFAAAGPRLWNGLPSHHVLQWHRTAGLSSRVVSASDCGVRRSRFESRRWQLCLSRRLLRYVQSWARAVHLYCSA